VTKTVLVIEDDQSVAQLLRDTLTGAGHRVLVESDGEWGLRTFESKPVDLVVVDVLVPKVVGFDLVHRIRKSEKGTHVPIIMISAVYRASVHRAKMTELYGILEYFDKPLDLDKLLYAVEQVPSTADLAPRLTIPPDVSAIDEAEAVAPAPVASKSIEPEMRGTLDEIPFARLLGRLYATRASGALMLKKSSMKKIVYLRSGLPVFVKSNLVNECLGRVMVRERLISEGECERSVATLKKDGRKQGKILIEMGCISPHNLEFALEQQLELKLFDVFSWLEGKYLFSEEQIYDGPEVALPMGPTEVLYEGVRRTMSTARVYRDLAVFEDAIIAPPEDATFRYQALQLEPRGDGLLDLIDGTQSVADVLDGSDLSRPDAAVLIYALACTGLVRLLESPVAEREQPPTLRPSLIDDPDLMALDTDEVAADEPAPKALAQARQRARAAAEEAIRAVRDTEESEAIAVEPIPEVRDVEEAEAIAPPEPPSDAPPAPIQPSVTEVDPMDAVVAGSEPPEDSQDVLLEDAADDEDARAARARASLLAGDAVETDPEGEPPDRLPTVEQVDVERTRQELAAELSEAAARLESRNFYERLGIHRHSTSAEIDSAYRDLAKRHAPDHVAAGVRTRSLRAQAERTFCLVKRARDTLMDPDRRTRYDATLEAAEAVEVAMDDAPVLLAEEAYVRGVAQVEAGAWSEAAAELASAVNLNPDEGAYQAHLAWARFCARPDDEVVVVKAIEALEGAAERSPDLDDVHVFAGLIYERLGQRDQALLHLRRAVDCNPDCVRALRAIRDLAPPPPRKSGLFGRLGA